MKALLMTLSTLLACTAATAADGIFTPQDCGLQEYRSEQQSEIGVQRVCVGQLMMDTQTVPAVQFEFTNGLPKTFQVVDATSFMVAFRSGITKQILHLQGENGEELAVKVVKDPNGQLQSVAGEINQLPYFSSMQQVFSPSHQ